MATTTVTTEKFIKKSFLMWVGKEHYPTIADYVAEASAQGVSKRMPTAAMAQALAKPGTVVFLAHDEGVYTQCPNCEETAPCWDCDGTGIINAGTTLEAECTHCVAGHRTGGTGGHVTIDGAVTPWIAHWRAKMYDVAYRNANHVVSNEEMCPKCGGKGNIPCGMVFGCFVPKDIEFIVPTGAADAVRDEAAKRGFKLVEQVATAAEPIRGCGRRKAGGVYVVTKDVELDIATKNKLMEELVATGKVPDGGATLTGAFLQFIEPITIEERRFRGLKKWDLTPETAMSAELMLEAVA
jgi:hypothetical protein